MSYDLRGQLSLKILFNGEEFPFVRANRLNFLHLSSSTKIAVPMLHLSLIDNIDFLSDSKRLSDAARIQVVLAARDKPSNTYVFRMNSYKRTPQSGGYQYDLDGYIDANTYWHVSATNPISGTSYKAIKDIAATCGLGFFGDQTADAQVWLPKNTSYHEWARLISERGYRSDTSCMQLGLNFDKTLTYRDLAGPRLRSRIFVFGEYRQGTTILTDIVPDTVAGSMNHYSGYADTHVEQDLHFADVYKNNSNVQVNKSDGEKSLLVNSRIKSSVTQSRVSFAPVDCGNSHPEYEKALYQNRRLNNLFSSRLLAVTPQPTDVKVLDKVSVSLDKSTGHLRNFSGDYFVSARAIHVQGFEYFEKFEFLRKSSGIELQDSL